MQGGGRRQNQNIIVLRNQTVRDSKENIFIGWISQLGLAIFEREFCQNGWVNYRGGKGTVMTKNVGYFWINSE